MPRLYTVTAEAVAVSGATNDLVTLLMPTTAANFKQVWFIRAWLQMTTTTLPTNQGIATRLRWLPATVTPGSGGSTPTPAKLDQGDAAAQCTAHTGDTTKSTTSGTAVTLDEYGGDLYNGVDSNLFGRPWIPLPNNNTLQQALVFELLSTLNGTVNLSYGIDFAEAG